MKVSNQIKNQTSVRQELIINAPADKVFPLVCPVMEYKWIKGWKCELIHLPDGVIEKDSVFKEIMSAPFLIGNIAGKTTWSTMLYDSMTHRVHFRLDNKVSTSIFKIEMTPEDLDKTQCVLELNYNPINLKGINFINRKGKDKIQFLISALAKMLKHYCETGEIHNSSGSERLSSFLKKLTKSEKIKLILNKFIMYLIWDTNKNRFLSGKPILSISNKYLNI